MRILLSSILAGVVGTGLGGLLTAMLGSKTSKMVSALLSFAGGVMISIVFYELIPEAIELTDTTTSIIGLVTGIVVALLLDALLDRVSLFGGHHHMGGQESAVDGHHAHALGVEDHKLLRSGVLMLLAIGLHNLPEGLAMGAAINQNMRFGLTLAMLIGIHNVPLGMAIAAPLVSGGLHKWKAVALTLAAGLPTVVGATAGAFLGGTSDLTLSLALSIAGGAMLYAVFGEFLPQSAEINKGYVPTLIQLAGILCGMLFTGIALH